ncbi:MmcQ protein [Lactobacillus sp. PV034]|uniref:MmcQ protein n=1 Tax=Lactobacillus sp. PV034 TaxID=2594495 RepID=UPI00223F1C5E|nr:MmcQ protein [Lactobacillus sp. PV034]
MRLENTIFKQYQTDGQKLLKYGFGKQDSLYFYKKKFFNNFEAQITITPPNQVKGKVIDLDIEEEYMPIHSSQRGKFVDEVRSAYLALLKDIRQNCFNQVTIYPDGPQHYWLIPANPKYFDIMNAFNNVDNIIWKQSTKIKPNDIIFMYVGAPISAIIYQCQVLEVNLPYHEHNKYLKINHVMRIKKILSYPSDQYTFKKLANYNVKAIRGPRHVPDQLLKDLLKKRK